MKGLLSDIEEVANKMKTDVAVAQSWKDHIKSL
jgi:hypothetical protein